MYTSTSYAKHVRQAITDVLCLFHSLSWAVADFLERRGALVLKIEQPLYQSCRMQHTPEHVVIMGIL